MIRDPHRSVATIMASLAVLLLACTPLCAQTDEVGLVPKPGYKWSFPRDDANHADYPVEWWYYTGHLLPDSADADDPAAWTHVQLTFFRSTVPGRNSGELYFAHLAMSGGPVGDFHYAERIARGTLGEAGSEDSSYHVWLDNWRVSEIDGRHLLEAYDPAVGGIRVLATPETEPLLHGDNGYSPKAPNGEASYYYSYPSMSARGYLLPPKSDPSESIAKLKPVRVKGTLWMDHEFGNQHMGSDLWGWDWWGLELPDGGRLMLYLIRRGGESTAQSEGTLLGADGTVTHLSLKQIEVEVTGRWTSPESGVTYPHSWRIKIPRHSLDLTVTPVTDDQELRTDRSTRVTYYEGAVTVQEAGYSKPAFGYVELVGYE